ncbi:hypothetical protein [Helicobacter ailurogastricus]|uniref:Uncharacterized protein n=1 Tax=Helicobacter ailurogastricus TaxID=1578720 RepID=A0A0K2X5H0_9HELI|nr:hypothetical protein [Helicobacter ailurogastricus]CRF40949.1 hypothetical protein HAL011_07220 [Helicobacter ailurogastricus]CRF42515.1 hypothetical protein HAL013_07030 [Helicobacter ailurogastricus]CRF44179.1 hypothetical protein HAL09_07520 [Helicobacter ailurogastricus]
MQEIEPDEYGRTERYYVKGAMLDKAFMDRAAKGEGVDLQKILESLELIEFRPNATLLTQARNGSFVPGGLYKISKDSDYLAPYTDKVTGQKKKSRTEGIFANLYTSGDEKQTQIVYNQIGAFVINKIKHEKELWDEHKAKVSKFLARNYLDEIKDICAIGYTPDEEEQEAANFAQAIAKPRQTGMIGDIDLPYDPSGDEVQTGQE